MKIRAKLVTAFGIVLLISALQGAVEIVVSNNINNSVKSISNKWLPSLGYISELDTQTSELRLNELQLITMPDMRQQTTQSIATLSNEINADMAKYAATMTTPEEKTNWATFTRGYQAYVQNDETISELVDGGSTDAALIQYDSSVTAYNQFKAPLKNLVALNINNGAKEATISQTAFDSGRIISFIALGLNILLGMLLAWYIAVSLTKTVQQLGDAIDEVAEGNLAIDKVKINTQDEISQMAGSFNTMVANLRALIKNVAEAAEQVAASSQELTASSEQHAQATTQVATAIEGVASGTQKQADAVNETSAAIEQVSISIQQVAENANSVAGLTDITTQATQVGYSAVNKAVSQMDNVGKSTAQVQAAIEQLETGSNKIGEISSVIADIASQTNLLALNAAIEAARAGEQGRGFAVVAEEVRKLAEQSQNAAQEITQLIDENKIGIDNAVATMNTGANEVKVGMEVVNTAGDSFKDIAASVEQVAERIKEISVTIQQMANGSQQIVDSIHSIDMVSKENSSQSQTVSAATEEQAASVEEIASASQNLAVLAQTLQNATAKFRV
ncbi:MAG: methyl-accepting chemotaxis protein [Peptococcaceae bacterium]|nr:methyl-accepting chemotaxis protein [Peptococcaceae bacterium]